MLNISFSTKELPKSGYLVLPTYENESLNSSLGVLDKDLQDSLMRAADIENYKGEKGKSCLVLAPSSHYSAILLIGLGKREALKPDILQEIGALIANKSKQFKEISVYSENIKHDGPLYLSLGLILGDYHFDIYRTTLKEKDTPKLETCHIISSHQEQLKEDWPSFLSIAKGVFYTRNLVTEPSNVLYPRVFVERLQELKKYGIDVDVFDTKRMEELGFGALLGVAQGSVHESYMVVMRYNGTSREEAPFAFVGKGVTFDSGGISLKPASGMAEMKEDMAGAGVVSGVMLALATRKAPVNAVGIVGLVENMASGSAQRPGDVVRSASGQTIEVLNTDAEGRLVLADLLWYAKEHFSPRCIVDLATLTGAMVVALGHEYAGIFSNDDKLASSLEDAGITTGEKLWRFPLAPEYDELLNSPIADMQNISSTRGAGSITAAQFLKRFIGNTPWAHLDIAGVAWRKSSHKGQPKGASGFGVMLLDRLVRDYVHKNS